MGKKSHKEKHKKKLKKEKKHKEERKEKKNKHKKDKKKSPTSDDSYNLKNESLKQESREESSEWGFWSTVLNDSNIVEKKKKEKNIKNSTENPGQNVRELNPYWKDGGCGLPPEAVSSTSKKYNDFSSYKSRLNFLKPGEGHQHDVFRNTYQQNWKKKESNIYSDNENQTIEKSTEVTNITKPSTSSSSSETTSSDNLNNLAAKLIKAEIMGNTTLVAQLKAELEAAKCKKVQSASDSKEKVVIVTDKGIKNSFKEEEELRPNKKQKISTHSSGKRVRYFLDDDKYSLKNLFEKEKTETESDQVLWPIGKNSDDLDDAYVDAAASQDMEKAERKRKQMIKNKALVKYKTLEGCNWCLENRNKTKHLIVSTGNKCYLCLPQEESFTKGHCLIVPFQHEISTLHLDEDVWEEIKTYQRALTKMFSEHDQSIVFFENARGFKSYPHCFIQCVPLDKETGDLAPIYFKKAIMESDTEWSNNKKVIDFRNKDLRRSIPKGLPYFAVFFGNEGGFAHVIEDEQIMKKNFAEEVLGGMMDLDHKKWRKPHSQTFKDQREKTLDFLKVWKNFEFNKNSEESDESSE